MEKEEIINNQKKYRERLNLFKSLGYDTEKERDFIIKKSMPLEGNILEVGTGKGYFTTSLAKKGYSFTTIDISKKEQDFAKLNIAYLELEKKVDFKIADIENLELKDKNFDIMFAINIIHHLKKPFKAIDNLIEILNKNGRIIVSDFNKQGFDFITKIHRSEGKEHHKEDFSVSDIEKHLNKKTFYIYKYNSDFQETIIAKKL